MSDEIIVGPYDRDKCHFCGKSAKDSPKSDPAKYVAGYRRGTDDNPRLNFDACETCARKPYPQPKQFQQEEAHVQ
jgi:hypothetical protein